MTSGIVFEQGEILIVPFPFSDLSALKQRPILVLSKKSYNENVADIITCGITSNINNAKYSVLIRQRDLESGYLPTMSRIKVDKLFTLEQSIVKKRLAKVNKNILKKVKEEFLDLI